MLSTRTCRLTVSALASSLLLSLPMGCSSGKVEEGGQINATISKEKAEKQNAAFQNYQKQSRANSKKPPG